MQKPNDQVPGQQSQRSQRCETIYLGWDAPLLPRAAEFLCDRILNDPAASRTHPLGLRSLVCVLPASRAVNRFRWLLQRAASDRGMVWDPPTIITVGQLPDWLYEPERPLASEFEQTLAWTHVLRQCDPADLQPLIPVVPHHDAVESWLELGRTLRRLHEDLSASCLTFRDVVDAAETDADRKRQILLSGLFESYRNELQRAGLADPHWSRRQAIDENRCRIDRTIALIGTSDLSDVLVQMLHCVDDRVLALVGAPQSEAFRFDTFGCVDTDAWLQRHLPLQDQHLVPAGDVTDQSVAVAEQIAQIADQYSPDQVTVGVTDESQVGPVELELQGCGLSTYRHLGWTIGQTAVGSLLKLAAEYVQRRTWQSLAALVRHGDVCRWVSSQIQLPSSKWLKQFDQLLTDFFPRSVDHDLTLVAQSACPMTVQVRSVIDEWLAEFHGADQPLSVWSGKVKSWVADLYPQSQTGDTETTSSQSDEIDPQASSPTDDNSGQWATSRTSLAVAASIRVLDHFSQLNQHLDVGVSGAMALEMLAARLADSRVVHKAVAENVEIVGWLDLALDDAPVLVVTGFNHPFVPQAVTSDPFLPGSLRSRLSMADNDRRFARDAYALHVMVTTRPFARFVVGRRAADQSPTPPSRLLAAAPADDVARRVRLLLSSRGRPGSVEHQWDAGPGQSRLPIPSLDPLVASNPVTKMSVTAFHDYLICPYRFFLRHVLNLRPLDDAATELAANQFGDLVHETLERFGRSNDRHETSASRIEASLLDHLHDYARTKFGTHVSSTVQLQITQAEQRLKAVAVQQAIRIGQGWMIHEVEASVGEANGAGIDVDGQRMHVRGRFDRIDVHEESGRWAILDYKTHGHKPEKKHLKKTEQGDQWIDLQLPLYRMMIPYLGISAPPEQVELGYFNISEKDQETRINIATFTEEQLQQAEELIHDCIRRIRAGDFAPTDDRVEFDDYEMILQTGVTANLMANADAGWEDS